ncbi:putative ficolin-2-like [Apostichopus japonicus]|uniref:Putative ficolin-2-like n=1 Tax=Stichopus japonicus TaxID=307972 RepID=A0A2G8LEU2_STIJA|nr:putative ficolin-2-like [Apostichopus japonicus]
MLASVTMVITYFLFQTPEYPRDCHEVLNQCSSTNAKSGVYLIKPDQYPEPFQTYCDHNTTSGGWTVIQRRVDGSIGFNRTWDEYKNGIGFLGSEFLIGNEKLSHLINQKRYQLRIELENYAGQSYNLTYDNFRIADEWGNYSITSLGVVEGITDLPITWCSSNKDNYDNTCERTCENPNDCVIPDPADPERCLCPENHMILGNSCIPQEQCGCYVQGEGLVLAEGESYINSDCSLRITCNSNVLTSESYSCSADATCEERNDVRRCYCNEWFEGDGLTCTRSGPIDCSDLYAANRRNNGKYTIYPAESSGFEVYCEMSSGGWTILQRRTGSSVNFYRNWNEYKNGFGIPTGDHWIGNDKIYSLTKQPNINYQLIEKTNTEGSTYHSRYSSFRISNEGDKYRLSLSDYNGNAGNNAMGANSGIDLVRTIKTMMDRVPSTAQKNIEVAGGIQMIVIRALPATATHSATA